MPTPVIVAQARTRPATHPALKLLSAREGRGGPLLIVCITKREKAESEAQKGKPKGTLESEIRNAIS